MIVGILNIAASLWMIVIEKTQEHAVLISLGMTKKNIVNINHHPLISYSITAAKNSKFIDKLNYEVIDYDNLDAIKDKIKEAAEKINED